VTWSWGAGWAAGLGALTGACWPGLGRVPGGRGVAVFAGVVFALAPPAGMIGVMLALVVAGAARVAGRDWEVAAFAVGIGAYPLLFLAAYRDPLRLAALMTLYLVAAVRYVAGRRADAAPA
jgi:glycerol-3-phosphate acyltransferase PlsY